MNGSRDSRRTSRRWILIAVATCVLVLIGAISSLFFKTNSEKSAIRDAAAAHLHVASDKVSVERYVTRGTCAVAEISAVGPPRKTYIVATRKQHGVTAVTQTSGEHFFDTDDPDWAYTCP